jgi:hypothetical protein
MDIFCLIWTIYFIFVIRKLERRIDELEEKIHRGSEKSLVGETV